MRIRFCLAVSLTSILLTAAPAFADPDGFVSGQAGLGSNSYEDDGSENYVNGQLRGSISQMLMPMLNVQGDLVYNLIRTNDDDSHYDEADFIGALHLYYRDSDRFLVGGFVQLGRTTQTYAEDSGDSDSYYTNRAYVGAEAQAYLDNLTLYGQVGYTASRFESAEYSFSGIFAKVQARYFLTEDFKVDLHGSYERVAYEGNDEGITTLGIGVGAEYRLPETQFSLFGSVDHYAIDSYGNNDSDTRVMVGLKFNFGTDTLLSRDRNGTTLDPVISRLVGGGPV